MIVTEVTPIKRNYVEKSFITVLDATLVSIESQYFVILGSSLSSNLVLVIGRTIDRILKGVCQSVSWCLSQAWFENIKSI
jgi:hypothetical protein